jgi:hypothetical protein
MRLSAIIWFVLLLFKTSFGQNRIHADIAALNNSSIRRTGHKNIGFTVDDKVLKIVKRHKKRYTQYLFTELKDTSKTIVAHLLLLKVTGDTMSVGETVYADPSINYFDYSISGLKFKGYIYTRRYEVDVKTVDDIRNRWIEVLGEQ